MYTMIDFETQSLIDIRKTNAFVYSQDESTNLLCLSFQFWPWDQAPTLWKPGDPAPRQLLHSIERGDLIYGHNVEFERLIWKYICHDRMQWPDVDFDQWRCTMAEAARMSLPSSLEGAGAALGLPIEKDKDGHKIMMRLCKPLPERQQKNGKVFDDDPNKYRRLYAYCNQDVASQSCLFSDIERLPERELELWKLDQRINLRGIPVDITAVKHARNLVLAAYNSACKMLKHATRGDVETPKQTTALLKHLNNVYYLDMKSIDAAAVKEQLAKDDLDPDAREILELRQLTAMSSTAKLDSMLNCANEDGRVRGCLKYFGASTGRWSGRGMQIQNFPRGDLKQHDVDFMHEVIPLESSSIVDLTIGNPIKAVSGCLRSMIRAEPGKRLMVGDFAQIEARVLAWVAGQVELLQSFAAGKDVYKEMAGRIYDIDVEDVSKEQRHIGKTAILGLGYGMGGKAFRDACLAMAGVKIKLPFAKMVVKAYREANPKIAQFWAEVNQAALCAVANKQNYRVGRCEFSCDSDWFRIELPCGRLLHYHKPAVVESIAPWSEGHIGSISGFEPHHTETIDKIRELDVHIDEKKFKNGWWHDCNFPKGTAVRLRKAGYKVKAEKKEPQMISNVQYWSMNSYTRKWARTRTYGGKLTENIVQATARDFLADAMLRVEDHGYPIIATVHDEIVCEVPHDHGSVREFAMLMQQVERWGNGCPVGVEVFESERYKK